jgi:LysM repeat protein
MSKFSQRTYKSRMSRSRSKNIRFFVISLIVIAACVFVLMKTRSDEPDVSTSDDTIIAVDDQVDPIEVKEKKDFEFKPESAAPSEEDTSAQTEPAKFQINLPDPGVSTEMSGSDDPQAMLLVKEALQDKNSGDLIAARDKLNKALTELNPQSLKSVKSMLTELATHVDNPLYRNVRFGNNGWLFSDIHYPGDTLTDNYAVRPGETLEGIGKKFKVPYEILMTINNIKDAKSLQAGEKIKVINGPFHAIIHRSNFAMDLYLGNNTFVKTYMIGLGTVGQETPTGRWRAKEGGKLISPTWTDQFTGKTYSADDPDYPLGSRWIGLDGLDGDAEGRTGFALHGTKDPESIGTHSSRGCVRLYNGEIIEVYNLMMPGHSEVLVVE